MTPLIDLSRLPAMAELMRWLADNPHERLADHPARLTLLREWLHLPTKDNSHE